VEDARRYGMSVARAPTTSSRAARPSTRAARTAAALAAVGFLGVALFQVALAAGADWGHAAWGGANAELSTTLRVGSAVAVLFWTTAAYVVLGRAGFLGRPRLAGLHRWGTWVVAALCGVGALANFASQSAYENLVFGPLSVVLATLCVVVARGSTH
jgi:hypothetical protein